MTSTTGSEQEIELSIITKDESRIIDLAFKSLTDENCEELGCKLAKEWSELAPNVLSLSCNTIGGKGANILFDILSSEPFQTPETLTHLDFSANMIGDEGVLGLVKLLESRPKLVHLNLRATHISDEGAATLAKILETNSTLEHLDLSANYIGDAGALKLAEAIAANKGLKSINILTNDIGENGHEALCISLKENPRIVEVNRNTRSDVLNDVCTIF